MTVVVPSFARLRLPPSLAVTIPKSTSELKDCLSALFPPRPASISKSPILIGMDTESVSKYCEYDPVTGRATRFIKPEAVSLPKEFHQGGAASISPLKMSLLSLATAKGVVLVRRPLLRELEALLPEDELVVLGVGVKEDVKLFKRSIGWLDLRTLACSVGDLDGLQLAALKRGGKAGLGLASLALTFLSKSLYKPKALQCSNWDMERLTAEQVEYAATDAWAAVAILRAIQLTTQLDEQGFYERHIAPSINKGPPGMLAHHAILGGPDNNSLIRPQLLLKEEKLKKKKSVIEN
jgi:hypothetical protein